QRPALAPARADRTDRPRRRVLVDRAPQALAPRRPARPLRGLQGHQLRRPRRRLDRRLKCWVRGAVSAPARAQADRSSSSAPWWRVARRFRFERSALAKREQPRISDSTNSRLSMRAVALLEGASGRRGSEPSTAAVAPRAKRK